MTYLRHTIRAALDRVIIPLLAGVAVLTTAVYLGLLLDAIWWTW